MNLGKRLRLELEIALGFGNLVTKTCEKAIRSPIMICLLHERRFRGILQYKLLDHISQSLADVCSLLLCLNHEELRDSGVLYSKLKMVHLSVELDYLLIFKSLFLDFLQGYGDVDIVHFETLILLVPFFLLLELFHETFLLAKEHLLTSALYHHGVNFLGQDENVVERGLRNACHFHLKLPNGPINLAVHIHESIDSVHAEFLDVRLLGESHSDLRLIIAENSLKVDDATSEESFKDDLFATNQY